MKPEGCQFAKLFGIIFVYSSLMSLQSIFIITPRISWYSWWTFDKYFKNIVFDYDSIVPMKINECDEYECLRCNLEETLT